MRGMLVAAAAIVVAAAGQARAADLPTPRLPPPLPAAVYNWTGIYLGINGGFGTGNSNWSDGPIGTTGNFPTSGFLIGGTAGINYQIGDYVFGAEGDGDWTNLSGNSGSTCGAISAVVAPPVSCQSQGQCPW
jgi:outer membrane immunogenic protein